MSIEEIASSYGINLWSSEHIPYGNQVTILGTPTKIEDKWVVTALEIPTAEIRLDTEIQEGKRLIIIGRNGSFGKLFGYWGILPEKLDEVTDKLAQIIVSNLQGQDGSC